MDIYTIQEEAYKRGYEAGVKSVAYNLPPTDREKLIELIQTSPADIMGNHGIGRMADHLLANGVTIQTWIPVTERLPEAETDVLVFSGGYVSILTYRYDRGGNLKFMYMDDCGYWHERFAPIVTHWMPLPEAPKE